MVGSRAYDLMYRFGAPWETGPREELVQLVESGVLSPERLPPGRAVDLGCGSGANTAFLAEHGFAVTGIDFSGVALSKARRLAEARGLERRVTLIQGDLTATHIDGVDGLLAPFDLLIDYGTLDDLKGARRVSMAATIKRLARPGARFLMWCFYGDPKALPLFSLRGVSRGFAGLVFDEERALFADAFDVQTLARPDPGCHGHACFLMTRREVA